MFAPGRSTSPSVYRTSVAPGSSPNVPSSKFGNGMHTERHRAAALHEPRLGVLAEQERRQVAGVDPAHGAVGRVQDHVEERRHLAVAELRPDEPVELVHDPRRVVALERVCAQGAAQLADHRRGGQPLAGHVAHHEPHAAPGNRDHVVPVAADLGLGRGGQVAGRHGQPRKLGQALRQQAALKGLRDAVLALVHARVVEAERHAVGGQAQHADVLGRRIAAAPWRTPRARR